MATFPFTRIRQRLLEGDNASTHAEKGAALEDVIVDSFCKVKGISFMRRDILNTPGSSEIDILLYNQKHSKGLPFVPDFILFECKNWSSPVGSAEVSVFIHKIRTSKLRFGILVATNGITGDADNWTAAKDIIRSSFDQDGTIILVLNRQEIESFRSADNIIQLIRNKFGDAILRI